MPPENPLRILVITSRPLTDGAGNPIVLLDVEEERRRMRAAVTPTLNPSSVFDKGEESVRLHFLPHATTGAVKTVLRDAWDVVHFTGHGTADGRLLLENDFGEAHALSQTETAQLFGECTARLAVLSACYSEIIARALNAVGIPALVAIDARVPIADRAAIIFAEHFYGALAKGWRIADAFHNAQQTVALDDSVGDAHPPLDDDGKPEAPWSQRFTLIGDGNIAFAVASHAAATAIAPESAEPRASSNLRARNANFVGRAKEIVEIVKIFDGRGVLSNAPTPRVAIIGAGGIGKTELSKAVAWWYVERGKVDAVLWGSASRDEGEFVLRDLASLLSIAARAFGLPITEQSSFDEQKRVVREFCLQHRAIVLLDSWEMLEGRARKEVWDFVKNLSDVTRVIVTSRDTLPPKDARNYELDTLTVADGARLFLNIARNAGYFDRNPKLGKEERAILSAMVERLGGYPLAIEVVAGQTESRALSDIWNDLVKIRKNVLEGKDELTGDPRGVWTSLGFSYDVLPAPAQTLFRQMGVFLAPATVEDVAAIVTPTLPLPRDAGEGGALATIREVLDALVRRSLVWMHEGAYALSPMVREYALGKLADAGQDARELHTRAANYYGQKGTLDAALTASEHLFELVVRFGERGAAEAFVNYVQGFYYDLKTRGYWTEARRKTEQLIDVARALGDKVMEAQAIGELGTSYQDIGEYERAAELHRQAQKTLAESGDKRGVAVILHQRGNLAYQQGNYAEAVRLYRESLKLKEELGDKRGIASTLHQLGVLAQDQGNYAEAVRLYRESMKIAEELGDKSGIVSTLHQLGNVEYLQGNYAEAMRLYRESMELKEELGDKRGIASTLHQLGMLAQQQGDYAEAVRLYRESMKIAEELGDKRGVTSTLHQLGVLAQDQGNYTEAVRLYRESMKIAEELGDKRGIAAVLHNLGMIQQESGNYEEAKRHFLESLKITEEQGDRRGTATTLRQLGSLARIRGEYEASLSFYQQSIKLVQELGDKLGLAITHAELSSLYVASKQYREAIQNALLADILFSELHSPHRAATARQLEEIRRSIGHSEFDKLVSEFRASPIGEQR